MVFLSNLFGLISLVAFLLLLVGLFKPWVVLWWEDHQNRKKVIKVYGLITVICFIAYRIILYL